MLKQKNKNSKDSKQGSTVSFDPYSGDSFAFQSNEFLPCNIDKINKNSLFVSYLKHKDINIGSVEIPNTATDDDIPNLITIKSFEEFGLDTEKDYKFIYDEIVGAPSENRIFNLFIADNALIERIFSPAVKRISYIDYIAAAPLLFEALYKKSILPPHNVDAFIAIQNDDAFLVVYQNGSFLQSRQLRYSLKYINEKFSSASGSKFSEDAFLDLIQKKDIDENSQTKEHLNQILGEMIYYIGDILNSIGRIYSTKIQHIHIVSDVTIYGLDKSIQEQIGIPASELEIKMSVSKNLGVSKFNMLATLAAQVYQEMPDNGFNFSIFLRPPPLFKRNSGKLILYTLLGFILAFGYPLYQYIDGFITEQHTAIVNDEYAIASAEERRIRNTHAQLDAERNATQVVLNEENERIGFRKKLLTEIHDKKVNYPMKGVVLYELTKLISQKDIKVGKVVNTDKNITIVLLSENEKQLTEFIQNVSNESKYSITTQEIVFDKNRNNPTYESNVTIKIEK